MPPQPVITLDVEGVFFKTRISTLKSIEGTYFSRLFETDWREQLDREGKLFIDRDSSVFPVILNFLRDHEKCPLPNDEYHLMRLLREAVHIAHVGWNGASVLFDKKMSDDPTVKKICDAAAEAVDLNAVYNVVNKNDAEESHSVEVLITGGVMQSRDGTSRH
uniref:BTB_2 domain-containing protein n=1 Tax=Caenorhabditis japonica TaxID=281687 RepID=A0A8R1HVC6_CAEJA